MKKFLAVMLSLAMALSMAGCGSKESASGGASGEPYKVALVIAGTLGDKSFYDSANEGLTKLKDELGADKFDFKVEQMGGGSADQANWEPTILDYCESGEYDLIITGSWQMGDPLASAANTYKDQKFIYFDETYDFDGYGNNENIYNVLFKQNEVSYLAGALAGLMTKTEGIDGINASDNIISVLGGQDSIVINDFVVGYIQGAKDVNPDIKVATSYVGNFDDAAKGKDLALSMFNAGSDIGFCVAGNAGNGQIEAAKETGKYAIGVDSDQAALMPDYAASIPTSAVKNVGNALYAAIKEAMAGELSYGVVESFGLADGGVELVKDAHYEEIVPEDIRKTIDELEQKVIKGEITVNSALTMSGDEVVALKDSVALQ